MEKLIKSTPVRRFFTFFVFLFIVLVVWIISSYATTSDALWYIALQKPDIQPPEYLSTPVWIFLYLAVAYVGYLLWTRPKSKHRTLALTFWILQLFFNGLWSYLFFSTKSLYWSAIDLAAIIFFVILTMKYSYKISKQATLLFFLYLIWLVYAFILNISIAWMNQPLF